MRAARTGNSLRVLAATPGKTLPFYPTAKIRHAGIGRQSVRIVP